LYQTLLHFLGELIIIFRYFEFNRKFDTSFTISLL